MQIMTEVVPSQKSFEDKVADFYKNKQEEKEKSRKLINEELTPFFDIMNTSSSIYVPSDNTGINTDFNNFHYNMKDPNHQ